MSSEMMLDQAVLLAAVTVLGLLEQAYFSLQVIYARRKYSVSPPATAGAPEFERVFRAQANCSEYFPLFIFSLWLAGVFFSQALAVFFGILYLYGRYLYFHGYAESAQGRLEPLYFSAKMLWALIGLSGLGVVCVGTQVYLGLDLLHSFTHILGLNENT
ncbi:leukotriene C4 synthase [Pseudorasbora parva]|uniref:leukotriene C4 synthase n=1 Tax=Pseudorasbora parva TaxID=51549 RepID=UPI00351E3734